MRLSTLVLLIMGVFSGSAFGGDTWVNGYTRSNGTYVQPYHRTAPNTTALDNYSTRGNYNPYTSEAGTKPVYRWDSPYRAYGE